MLFQGEYDPLTLARSRRETATPVATRPAFQRKRTNMRQHHVIRLRPDESHADESRARPTMSASRERRGIGNSDPSPMRGRIGRHPITGAPIAAEGIPAPPRDDERPPTPDLRVVRAREAVRLANYHARMVRRLALARATRHHGYRRITRARAAASAAHARLATILSGDWQ